MKKLAIGLYVLATVALLGWAYYQAIYVAPNDAAQGEMFRIIYYHVPSATVAFLFFGVSLIGSIGYLATRHNHADRAQMFDAWALAGAEVGVVFCSVVLVTGPMWGRRAWGIWWTWGDARLVTTLLLWLIYVSYLVLRRFSNSAQTQMLAAALAVFGALDVPLVYFSIWFFRTQHPQPVIGGGGSIDPRMLHVLLINWLAFSCFALLVSWWRYRLEILQREVDELESLESLSGVAQ